MSERRTLRFDSLAEAVRDAETLLAKGYDKVGYWDLAQVCRHLTEWLRYPMDGFPKVPLLMRLPLWMVRVTIGKRLARQMNETGTIRPGLATTRQSVFAPGGDETAAVDGFRAVVARWESFAGPYHPSPLFGELSPDDRTRGHCVHCAHHLSFLVPKGG